MVISNLFVELLSLVVVKFTKTKVLLEARLAEEKGSGEVLAVSHIRFNHGALHFRGRTGKSTGELTNIYETC